MRLDRQGPSRRSLPSRRRRRPLLLAGALALLSLVTVAVLWTRRPEPTPPTTGPSGSRSDGEVDRLGKRDTLSEALARLGVADDTAGRIVTALREVLDLRRLQPGDRLDLHRTPDGAPSRLVYTQTPLDIYEVTLRKGEWRAGRRQVPVERRTARVAGEVRSSLFESLDGLGEAPQLALDFVEIFVWTIDFNQDSQPGDRFRILVEKLFVDGAFAKYGRILAAEYESRRRTHTAVYFAHGRTGGYYTPQGESLKRTFLKSPLEFTRISSGYSRARRHPILGGVRPHLAVDYAAPAGTPVWAVAHGVVEHAGWRGGNGLTVTIRHRANFQTMYNHLSRLGKGIRRGARVRQRQAIGFVGSTGLSTGPHLDFRVIKGGRFVNPLKETFLPGHHIPPRARAAFGAARDRVLTQLRIAAGPDRRQAE